MKVELLYLGHGAERVQPTKSLCFTFPEQHGYCVLIDGPILFHWAGRQMILLEILNIEETEIYGRDVVSS